MSVRSIEFIRQIIELKTKSSAFSYPTYEEVYRHVFVHTAIEIVAGLSMRFRELKNISWLYLMPKVHLSIMKMRETLKCESLNSRSNQENAIDDVSVAVMKVLS